MSNLRSAPRRLNAIAFAKFLNALVLEPSTYYSLVEASGLHYATVMRYVIAMHQEGCVHIFGWEPDSLGRPARAVYALGPGKDAPREGKPDIQRWAEHNERKKLARQLGLLRKAEPTRKSCAPLAGA